MTARVKLGTESHIRPGEPTLTRRELTLVLESIAHDANSREDDARREDRPKVAAWLHQIADELRTAARKLETLPVLP